ncbi:unnamed protein product [Polarella glacialis]|uniref:Uncharacterized protein n=1 Tax=Polarella glacialis TaxID=89957 RepID=A0A813J2U3_POLGL|nr:unnamed protein product [Polarella glacialis]CAE8666066.1 unnamed protein product [Polarella glacialis]
MSRARRTDSNSTKHAAFVSRRCSSCTRPLGPRELAERQLLCLRCSLSTGGSPTLGSGTGNTQNELQQRHRRSGTASFTGSWLKEHSTSGCQTPSTEAVSEDGADAAQDSSCFGTPPPTPGQVMAGTLKKSLGGAWVGAEGESYIILCDDLFLTCVRTDNRHWGSGLQGVVSEPGQKNSRAWSKELFFDFRDNMIWWGRERSYFLDVSEIRWTPEEVTWHVSGNGEGPRQPFTWHRPHENWADAAESTQMKPSVFGSVNPVKVKRWNKQPRVASPSEPREASPETVATKQQASKELPAAPAISAAAAPRSQSRWEDHTWCSAKDWCSAKEQRHGRQSEGDSLAAWSAIQEIEEQLDHPENTGFIWIDHWNERFLPQLGTLRGFLESRPDRFAVTRTSGKGYRVASSGTGPTSGTAEQQHRTWRASAQTWPRPRSS